MWSLKNRCAALLPLAGFALLTLPAIAQTKPANMPKEFHFEVFSMRPMEMAAGVPMRTGPSPTGFDSRMSLYQAIMLAYGPDSNPVNWGSIQLLKGPNWLGDFYDIKARVSQSDLKAWQNQSKDHELLRAALRAALKERCKLAIHEQPAKGEIFELVVAKSGSRLKASVPAAALPVGVKLKNGGVMVGSDVNGKTRWDWQSATMQDLTDFLSSLTRGLPVRDRTGLTGRYDFTIRQVNSSPEDNPVYGWPIDRLGLQLKRGTENRPDLVIDHIEKPTPN